LALVRTTGGFVKVVTPVGTAGPAVNVAVTTFTNPPVVLTSAYTYVNPPTISSILPNRGSTSPAGQTVTLTGTNFEAGGQTSVTIDGIVRVPVVASATSLTFTTPVHPATGAVNVTVSTFTPAQTSAAATYTYVDPATTVDLALGMIADTTTPALNGNVTFTLTLSNTGTLNATTVTVRDLLPAGLNFVSATPSAGTYTAATGNWVVGTVNTGSSATLSLVAQVTSATSIVNFAQVTACAQPDIDSTVNVILGEDDEASVTITAGLTIQTAAALPGATSGAFYFQQIVATGGVPVYQWSLTSAPGSLPFNLDPATGIISGTAPLAAATYAFTLTVSDSSAPAATASRLFSIIVSAPAPLASPTITTTPAPPAGIVQQPYSHTFTATGGPVPTWSVSVGSLPAGLLLNTLTGQVGGTPTTVGGPVNFTMRATNANGFTESPFSITIAANPLTFITPSLPDGSVGSIYDQPVQISGGTGSSFTWSVVPGLPSGLTLTPTVRKAMITGTPTTNAAFSFTIQVQDNSAGGLSVSKLFTGQILSGAAPFAPSLPAIPPVGTLGKSYTLDLTGVGGTRPYSWTLLSGILPPGLTLNGGIGTISGTPTSAGSFQVTLRGNDSAVPNATANQTFTLTIAPAPLITTASPLPNATNGVVYALPLTVSGGVAPFSWAVTASAPPAGLSLSPLSGVLAGTPGAPGTAIFDVTVTDANLATATKSLSLTVANPAGALTILNGLPPALVGVPWSATIQATGGTAPYTFSLAPGSTLPTWATFDAATGTIYGTPDASPVTLQIRVTDSLAAFVDSNALVVNTALAIVQTTLSSGNVGSGYATTLVTTGGSGVVTWTIVSGSLPNGLALNSVSGLISGTPQTNGASTFLVRAADTSGGVAQRQFTITIGGAIVVGGGGGGGGGGCGLLGAEVLLLWMLRRVRRRRAVR